MFLSVGYWEILFGETGSVYHMKVISAFGIGLNRLFQLIIEVTDDTFVHLPSVYHHDSHLSVYLVLALSVRFFDRLWG